MIQTDFETFITTQLGGNLIDIELTSNDILWCFNRAKQTFIQKGNNNLDENYYKLAVKSQITSYTVDTSIDTIIKLIQPSAGFYTNDPFSMAIIQDMFLGFYQSGQSDLLEYEMTLQLIERIQRMTVYNPPFMYNKRTNTLKILKTPQKDDVWFLHCYSNATDDEYRDHLWVQQWAAAEAKILLGQAYRKFSEVETPAGSAQLPGQDLIQEGKEEQQNLLENIADYVDAGEPIGGPILIG